MFKRPETKEEKLKKRLKRDRIAWEAIQLHKKNREAAYIAKGGYTEVKAGEGMNEDWQSKVGAMKQQLVAGKSKLQARGKEFFRSR